ncbi:hypothetical protein ACIQZI_01110 [Peribacillus sp. NPDC096379]|uniref:hypothetical protein n=1 Tax=Peribacillus sp. NPDC096379 TaxID=3364393 RepID=UPI0037F5C341
MFHYIPLKYILFILLFLYWDDSFNKWFDGPDDPNYVFLQIQPETIRILNKHGEAPIELEL